MEVEIIRDRERTANVKGVGRVNGEMAIEADMMFSYTGSSLFIWLNNIHKTAISG